MPRYAEPTQGAFALEADFRRETRKVLRRRTVIASVLAMVLVPLFGTADYLLYPEQLEALLGLRVICLVATAAILFLLRGPLGEKHPEVLAVVLGVEVALTVAAIPVYLTGVQTPHYVTLALLLLSLVVLLPLGASQVTSLMVFFVGMYAAAALLHGPIPNEAAFSAQLSAVFGAGVIAIVSAMVNANGRRSEFTMRRALQVASEEKTGLIEGLREQKTKLEALNQDMEDVLYVASHDLRAPLINVQGFAREVQIGLAELRTQSGVAPEASAVHDDIEESLRFILSAISRMDGLIGALLNVSRIGTRTNPTEEVQLRGMVEKIIESFRYQLDQSGIEVRVEPLPVVKGDELRLNQVFSNLLDNAVKYMGDSAIRTIEIGARNGNGTPTFFVSDTGPGIPRESHETIFRLFRRLHNGAVAGEGLGLTMVRKIVEKHGGRIWVESTPGEGTTFYFTLKTENGSHSEEVR